MSATVFALIDCNNFFVSCERLFRPDLENKPVVVLSSNDGCAVARSNEAKHLGIPMGAPAFKYRPLFQKHQITTFSANFALYGEVSKRITELLTTITPRIEIYSVDESFLDLSALPIPDYAAWGREVRALIWRYIGVSVSIGIAPTKTLAKLASETAKYNEQHQGAVSLVDMPEHEQQALYQQVLVEDIWGVGRKLAPKLRADGVATAYSLARMRPARAQQLMGIHGRKMVAELNGTSCYGLEAIGEPAKSIMRSRTFGEDTSQEHVLEAAIATLAAQAAFRLRRERLLTKRISLFMSTNRHKPGYRQWLHEVRLTTPTNDSGTIISALVDVLGESFNRQQQYHRLGIYLADFVPESALQIDLLGTIDPSSHDKSTARMQALDAINARWGKGKILYAAEHLSKTWQPKQKIRSPRYLTEWDELPTIRIV